MRKIKLLMVSLIAILILIMCSTPAFASESKWYEEKAEAVGNPVVKDIEYYEGVSLTSNPISDLTYLEIPFGEYLNGTSLATQIITFNESMYYNKDVLKSELVMYAYVPINRSDELTNIEVSFEALEQNVLIQGNFIELTDIDKYSTNYIWSKINNYGKIYKFAYSKMADSKKGDTSLNSVLFRKYTSATHKLVNTTFNCNVEKLYYSGGTIKRDLKEKDKWLINQEFMFTYEKQNEDSEKDVHYNSVCNYNTSDAKVEGEAIRLRFTTDKTSKLKKFILDGLHDYDYTDFFYFAFNVYNAVTGEKWTGNEVIKKINYTFYEHVARITKEWREGGILGDTNEYYAKSVKYNFGDGRTYFEDYEEFHFVDLVLNDKLKELNFNTMTYLPDNQLSEIYQKAVQTPKTFTNKFPRDTWFNHTIRDWFNSQKMYEVTFTTLFKTNDPDVQHDMQYELLSGNKLSNYQFMMLYGSETGYPATDVEEIDGIIVFSKKRHYVEQSTAVLVAIDNIEYEYQGKNYQSRVVETKVDNSNLYEPDFQEPDDEDGRNMFPGEEVPDFWSKLKDWFSNLSIEKILKTIIKIFVFAALIIILFKMCIRWLLKLINKADEKIQGNKKE